MRWSVILGGVGVTLATLAGSAVAQYGPAMPYPPGVGSYGAYGPLPPGCTTPMMPYVPAMPSMAAPGYGAPGPVYPSAPPLAPGAPSTASPTPGGNAPSLGASELPGGFGANATFSDPSGLSAAEMAAGAAGGAAESRGEAGSDALASVAPNMYGDVFGGGLTRFTIKVPTTERLGGTFINTATGNPALFQFNRNVSLPTFATQDTVTVFGTPINGVFTASGPITQIGNRQVYPLAPNPQDAAATLAYAQATIGPGGELTYVSDPSISRATAIGSPTPAGLQNAEIATFYDYSILQLLADNVVVPTPSSGGLVGRTKVSEDNNPLPRDRVFFNYDYFGGVGFGPTGQGVHRFSPGFEMTFFDGWTSVEVRVPFAGTLNSNIVSDGMTSDAVLLGNANVTFKALAYRSDWLYVAGGLAIAAPTGSDVGVRTEAGEQLLRLVNESVVLTPYAAFLLLPTENTFVMGFYSVAFDTMGNPVEVNLGGDRLRNVGRIYDAPFQMVDAQIGAWLYRNRDEYAMLRGVAGFIEGHYNMNLGSGTSITGVNFSVLEPGSFNELNLTAGLTAMLSTNSTITVGAAFPVLGGDNKSFDFQVGVRANVFFGPTARNRSIALRESMF